MFKKLNIKVKLTLLFLMSGLVPMLVLELIAYHVASTMKNIEGTRYKTVAVNIADKIDRNLFERYGDQANALASKSTHDAEVGSEFIGEMVYPMTDINESPEKIAGII